jgi:hypothetical protein
MSKDDVAVEISSVQRGFMNGRTKKANRLGDPERLSQLCRRSGSRNCTLWRVGAHCFYAWRQTKTREKETEESSEEIGYRRRPPDRPVSHKDTPFLKQH